MLEPQVKSGDEDETRPSDLIQAQTCHVKGSFISNTSERAILEWLMNVYFSVSINICKILHLYNRYWHSYSGNGVPKTADTKWSNFGEHSAISHKCTRIYIFLFDRSIIGSSPLVRAGLMHMCWSTFGSCGFRQILKIYFSYKALLAFLKYLQHRSEGLPKLIWSWNWLYVQFF